MSGKLSSWTNKMLPGMVIPVFRQGHDGGCGSLLIVMQCPSHCWSVLEKHMVIVRSLPNQRRSSLHKAWPEVSDSESETYSSTLNAPKNAIKKTALYSKASNGKEHTTGSILMSC